jgi:hypothetical protein
MSKMSRGLLEFMDRFALQDSPSPSMGRDEHSQARRASAGAHF